MWILFFSCQLPFQDLFCSLQPIFFSEKKIKSENMKLLVSRNQVTYAFQSVVDKNRVNLELSQHAVFTPVLCVNFAVSRYPESIVILLRAVTGVTVVTARAQPVALHLVLQASYYSVDTHHHDHNRFLIM